MKIAVVSDIHGNINNLKKFIKYIDEEDINIVFNLGDILGGENPVEALKIIMNDKRFINVCGNHDESLINIKEDLTREEIKWLEKLPKQKVINIENNRFLLLHSRINDNKSIPFLYNEKSLEEFLRDYEGKWDYVLFGHTHYQCLLSFYTGKIMVNPGSLGLSYDEKISFAIIDENEGEIDIIFKKIDNDSK
ncbi:MAG: metallophosphoesterase family protein [Clostridiaceae bacterium]|nr:metallophosphoesterase family protein [Clostridiaceae bacterium]